MSEVNINVIPVTPRIEGTPLEVSIKEPLDEVTLEDLGMTDIADRDGGGALVLDVNDENNASMPVVMQHLLFNEISVNNVIDVEFKEFI